MTTGNRGHCETRQIAVAAIVGERVVARRFLPGISTGTEGREMVVGRDRSADMVLDFPEISKRHVGICFGASVGTCELRDLGSTQGVYVDGRRLPPFEYVRLSGRETIIVGRANLVFEGLSAGPADRDDSHAAPVRSGDSAASKPIESFRPAFSPGDCVSESPVQPASPGRRGRANPLISQIQDLLLQRVDFLKIVNDAEDDREARERVREQIGFIVYDLARNRRVAPEAVADLEREAVQDILGYGPIQDLIENPRVSEIMVNRFDQVYYEMDGRIRECGRAFQGDEHVRQILMRMLKPTGRRIDEANPTVNARLGDGSRLHAVVAPLALDGTVLTIRKFHRNLTLDQLIGLGTLTAPMARFLELACRERQNIVISGGTGSGKTTLLNCVSAFVPESERVVTIEDTAELSLQRRHVIRLQSRPANTEGIGHVSIQRLVVEALRMRPDRIVVGECRHAEALDMLQAMNTGHEGSMTTVHANSARDAISRIETMTLMSGVELPIQAIRQQIGSAVDLVVQVGRLADGSRRILEIAELTGIEDGQIVLQPVFEFRQEGMDKTGVVRGVHAPTGHICRFLGKMDLHGGVVPQDIFDIGDSVSANANR